MGTAIHLEMALKVIKSELQPKNTESACMKKVEQKECTTGKEITLLRMLIESSAAVVKDIVDEIEGQTSDNKWDRLWTIQLKQQNARTFQEVNRAWYDLARDYEMQNIWVSWKEEYPLSGVDPVDLSPWPEGHYPT